jgi:hypothetical protein
LADRLPCYVMLMAGKADMAAEIFDQPQNSKFFPDVIV